MPGQDVEDWVEVAFDVILSSKILEHRGIDSSTRGKEGEFFFSCSALESSDHAKMPACRCVVQDCSNKSNPRAGISLHRPKSSQEVAKWKAFVRIHRANFNPKGLFKICSIHFAAEYFERQVHIEGQPRNLVLGAIPTIWKKSVEDNSPSMTARGRRQVSALLIFDC